MGNYIKPKTVKKTRRRIIPSLLLASAVLACTGGCLRTKGEAPVYEVYEEDASLRGKMPVSSPIEPCEEESYEAQNG